MLSLSRVRLFQYSRANTFSRRPEVALPNAQGNAVVEGNASHVGRVLQLGRDTSVKVAVEPYGTVDDREAPWAFYHWMRAEAPLVGDYVRVRPAEGHQGLWEIDKIYPRASTLQQFGHLKETHRFQQHSTLSNVSQFLIFASPRPTLNTHVVDSYLAHCVNSGYSATIIVNKVDLLSPDELSYMREHVLRAWAALPFVRSVIEASAKTRQGEDAIREAVRSHTSVFVGAPLTGKSEWMNILTPTAQARINTANINGSAPTHRRGAHKMHVVLCAAPHLTPSVVPAGEIRDAADSNGALPQTRYLPNEIADPFDARRPIAARRNAPYPSARDLPAAAAAAQRVAGGRGESGLLAPAAIKASPRHLSSTVTSILKSVGDTSVGARAPAGKRQTPFRRELADLKWESFAFPSTRGARAAPVGWDHRQLSAHMDPSVLEDGVSVGAHGASAGQGGQSDHVAAGAGADTDGNDPPHDATSLSDAHGATRAGRTRPSGRGVARDDADLGGPMRRNRTASQRHAIGERMDVSTFRSRYDDPDAADVESMKIAGDPLMKDQHIHDPVTVTPSDREKGSLHCGFVIDTLGAFNHRAFGIFRETLPQLFPDLVPFSVTCSTPACDHRKIYETAETCGVIAAAARGLISPIRFDSYQRLVADTHYHPLVENAWVKQDEFGNNTSTGQAAAGFGVFQPYDDGGARFAAGQEPVYTHSGLLITDQAPDMAEPAAKGEDVAKPRARLVRWLVATMYRASPNANPLTVLRPLSESSLERRARRQRAAAATAAAGAPTGAPSTDAATAETVSEGATPLGRGRSFVVKLVSRSRATKRRATVGAVGGAGRPHDTHAGAEPLGASVSDADADALTNATATAVGAAAVAAAVAATLPTTSTPTEAARRAAELRRTDVVVPDTVPLGDKRRAYNLDALLPTTRRDGGRVRAQRRVIYAATGTRRRVVQGAREMFRAEYERYAGSHLRTKPIDMARMPIFPTVDAESQHVQLRPPPTIDLARAFMTRTFRKNLRALVAASLPRQHSLLPKQRPLKSDFTDMARPGDHQIAPLHMRRPQPLSILDGAPIQLGALSGVPGLGTAPRKWEETPEEIFSHLKAAAPLDSGARRSPQEGGRARPMEPLVDVVRETVQPSAPRLPRWAVGFTARDEYWRVAREEHSKAPPMNQQSFAPVVGAGATSAAVASLLDGAVRTAAEDPKVNKERRAMLRRAARSNAKASNLKVPAAPSGLFVNTNPLPMPSDLQAQTARRRSAAFFMGIRRGREAQGPTPDAKMPRLDGPRDTHIVM